MTGACGWIVRSLLFGIAVVAPAVGYAARVARTGDAETAIDGLGWGLIGTFAALVGLALTFRATGAARLGRFAPATVGVLAVWGAVLGIANL